jgi:predicted Zn-dependent protease
LKTLASREFGLPAIPRTALERRTQSGPVLVKGHTGKLLMRYSVLRFSLFVLLSVAVSAFAQDSAEKPGMTTVAPQPVSAEVVAAEAAIASADWKAAEAKLDPWLAAHSSDGRALFDAGYVADAQNRDEDAAGFYRRAIEANPQSFEAHVSLGLLLAREGKQTDARPELVTATTLDPGEAGLGAKARAWRALAEIDRVSDPVTASTELVEALKISPETPADTLLAANLADKMGQSDAAEATYRRILTKDANSAAANAGLAHLLIARKQYPEAETLLRAALQKAPGDTALSAQLATVLAAEDKAEALPLLQKLHADHPGSADLSRMLAEVLAQAGDATGSDQLYLELLKTSPEDVALLVGHGQNLIRQLKYAAAFAVFDKATRLDPANGDGWSGLAFAASRTNQPSITIRALEMRAKSLPELPSTYFLWATAYDTLHQKANAVANYHHFLDASAGKFPDQEWQARQRLHLLEK